MRRPVATVIGSTRASAEQSALAHALGLALVDAGLRVLTGGLGGVMEAALRGARASARYQSGDTIAVLPTYRAADANDAADIVICTGMNHARNTIAVASAAVVLAVGGRSGTLGELALAWELGRPVICVGETEGWATRLAGAAVDDRRADVIHGPLAPKEAATLARELAEQTTAAPSFG
ncbi:TIGR00725 family protein [Haliangium ochraceum]|uniref:TIGR00725 family protein n=1 Tax=Haliangium ochraceum (strain DSM 14365 / JCM 11303 / SMP-2) TaxID=502025 RepID=D0LPT5_HALO1|nr:TIGR00725 family protein [Haliangium ochraceum]ACY15448.1 conserved hypothetical protein [Haliangium ochraceum DSM 14365]